MIDAKYGAQNGTETGKKVRTPQEVWIQNQIHDSALLTKSYGKSKSTNLWITVFTALQTFKIKLVFSVSMSHVTVVAFKHLERT